MPPFVLHEWTVIPERDLLLRSERGGVVERKITPLEMKLLVRLSREAGAVVSKETLLREVWEGACVVEHVLPKVLSKLRASLDDTSHLPRFIETIPRRGYRLIATPAAAHPEHRVVPRPSRLAAWCRLGAAAASLLVFASILPTPKQAVIPPVRLETKTLFKYREHYKPRYLKSLQVPVRIAVLPLPDEGCNPQAGDSGDDALPLRWDVEIDTGM